MTNSQPGPRRIGLDIMQVRWALGPGFDRYIDVARAADAAGIHELHISDHVAMSERAVQNRASYPWPIDLPYYESLTALGALATVTDRIRFATNVLVAPLRPAIFLARQAATVDAISGGRLELGLGAGWQREEFEASNVDFTRRRAILLEHIAVCRALWSSAPAAFHGESVHFDDLHSLPLPPQGRDLPITLGLPLTPANLRVIGEVADGWTMPPGGAAVLRENVLAIRAAVEAAGRPPGAVRVTVKLPPLGSESTGIGATLDAAAELYAAGADTVVARLPLTPTGSDELSEYFAQLAAVTAVA